MRGFGSVVLAIVLALTANEARAQSSVDRKPPTVRHTPVASVIQGKDIEIVAEIRDESGVFAPLVWFREPGAETYSSVDLVQQPDKTFKATLPSTGALEYWLEAYDELGNGPARAGSPEAPFRVEVTAPPPPSNTLLSVANPDATSSTKGTEPTPVATEAKATTANVVVEQKAEPPKTEAVGATPESPAKAPPAALTKEPSPSPVDVSLALAPKSETHPAIPAAAVTPPPDEADWSTDTEKPVAGPPVYKRWWFIGGASVVGAAAVGGLIYALIPRTVEQNVFTPSMRRP